jgi:hypothetical protein
VSDVYGPAEYIAIKGDQALWIDEHPPWFAEGEVPEPTITPITITKIEPAGSITARGREYPWWWVYYRKPEEPNRLCCETVHDAKWVQALERLVHPDRD